MNELEAHGSRVALTFHRTFSLSLPSVSKILLLSSAVGGRTIASEIQKATGLGSIYVEAMPRYARACGLMEMNGYGLTPFGELVCRTDPHLIHENTLWLMHYHMSAPHGPGPAFWSHLVVHALQFGDEVSRVRIAQEIAGFHVGQGGATSVKERTVRTAATVFLGTYTKSDALGRLALLEHVPERDGYVRVSESQSPPLGAVTYALADYWAAHFGEQVTVSLSELAKDDGFARLMWMNYRQLDEVLMELKRENIVDLYRVAPPYQVVRQWSTKQDMLARLYA